VRGLCAAAGYSRQAYYRGCRTRRRQEVDEEAVVEQVKAQRRLHPRIGTRKLCVLVGPALREQGIALGRDRLFALLKRRDLLVKRRRNGARTTDSRHGLRTRPNLIRRIEATMPDQVWVSDITYVRTQAGFLYLSLVMDAYSRKVLGYCAHDNLEAEGCLRALRQALSSLAPGARPIHHSDRGLQYCSTDYVNLLEARGCPVSMTELNHCYENAQAERLNGILKQEYALDATFSTKAQARAAIREAVELYNAGRPHTALGYRTPSSVYASGRAA
jgi:putative transposase